jgi:hypothetical protein
MAIPNVTITPASVAVNNANKVIKVAQLLASAQQLANEITSSNSVSPMGNGWALLNTIALGSDNSLTNGVADTTPNTANPINPALYPTLLGAYTSVQLEQYLGLVVSFQTFANGASASNGLAPALLLAAPVISR